MKTLDKDNVALVLAAMFLIGVSIAGDIWSDHRLTEQQYGLVFAMVGCLVGLYVAFSQDNERLDQYKPTALFSLGMAAVFFFVIAIISFAIGACGDGSWSDFVLIKTWKRVYCSSLVATSYGFAASIVVLVMLGVITTLLRIARR